MPAYNFKAQFAQSVKDGTKLQTIRPHRKHPTRVGDILYLFTGQRTAHCQLLRKAHYVCIEPIDIHPTHIVQKGKVLSVQESWELAQADGFEKLSHFYDFFQENYSLPLIGKMELIKWL